METCKHETQETIYPDGLYAHGLQWCKECGSYRKRQVWISPANQDPDLGPEEVRSTFEVLLEAGVSKRTIRGMRLAYELADSVTRKARDKATGITLILLAPALAGAAAFFATPWLSIPLAAWCALAFIAGLAKGEWHP